MSVAKIEGFPPLIARRLVPASTEDRTSQRSRPLALADQTRSYLIGFLVGGEHHVMKKIGIYTDVATVNRELPKSLAMLSDAVVNDWLIRSPSKAKKGELIVAAHEAKRQVVAHC